MIIATRLQQWAIKSRVSGCAGCFRCVVHLQGEDKGPNDKNLSAYWHFSVYSAKSWWTKKEKEKNKYLKSQLARINKDWVTWSLQNTTNPNCLFSFCSYKLLTTQNKSQMLLFYDEEQIWETLSCIAKAWHGIIT